jgi:hypothetical protein
MPVLLGARGLLPAAEFLRLVSGRAGFTEIPTIFWWTGASDTALTAAAIAGALASALLAANVGPRAMLAIIWALYLSFASVGQDFLSFQWDNLLLESVFFALFIAPGGWRPVRAAPPHPPGVFLMLWLVLRLHVESGLAKLLTGDPTWRDLTAMATYYETAPIPTWLGWFAHQMPLWAHKACSLFTFVVELALPLLIWMRSGAVRAVVFLFFIAMQVSIVLTANYGFFNYLTMGLSLFVLDDRHLAWAVARLPFAGRALGVGREPGVIPCRRPLAGIALIALAVLVVPLSIVPFVRFFRAPELSQAVEPARRVLSNWRSINAYHLFASMTLVRREAVIEGSEDGATWRPYEFHYKAGDVRRAPPFVAPHQPRVDFQLWFLLLGGRADAEYFNVLLLRLLTEPRVVAPLFAVNPFGLDPPPMIRVSAYRYTFTSAAERRASGAWWNRTLERTSAPITAESLRR